jgi:hypothetical protein
MASKRPYFSSTGPQLQNLFEANRNDTKVLRDLLAELKHRSTPTAHALKREVEEALSALQSAGSAAGGSQKPKQAPPPPPPPPPSHHMLTCRGCSTALRVPVRPERSAFSCPTCKTDFETVFKDGLLQVVWVEAKPSGEDSVPVMTDALAREILGVTASSDFAAIKAAWRKASQQYHPDKHQALPERLRKAAESEMKRINEAFRFLEGNTAADF